MSSSFSLASPDRFGLGYPPPLPPSPPPAHPTQLMNNINSLSLEVLCDDEVPTLSVPPITAIDPRPNHDDEVSSLSFMGDSDLAQDRCVPPNPDHRGSYHDEGQDNEEEGREPSVAKSRIDANDFDNRERCRRHPASNRGTRSCSGGDEGPQV